MRGSDVRRRAAGAILATSVVVLCSCSGGSQRSTPPPAGTDLCGLLNNFQVFNFTAKSGKPVSPHGFEVFYRGLIDGAAKVAQAKPELRGSLDTVVNGDLATATGKPVPNPDLGQPTFATADATITGYQQQACATAK